MPSRFDPDSLEARDPALISRILPIAGAFAKRYLRARCEGFELHVSADVPALYVANHNGGIAGPDLACTLWALWSSLGPSTPLYALTHDFAMRHSEKIGLGAFARTLQKLGSVRASQSNGARALAAGAHLLVYPGGDLDAYRHWKKRDAVVLGERTGFVRLAQRARVPIVPIVAHGAHRSAFIVAEGKRIARALRMKRWARLERFPIAIALPWGLALGP